MKKDWKFQHRAALQMMRRLHNRPILVSPTGSGKTHMAVEIVRALNARCLWLAGRRELVGQAHAHLVRAGAHAGVIMAGESQDRFAPIQVASVQTISRRDVPEVDLVVIDECHHAIPGSEYEPFLSLNKPTIGLTATPFRLDGTGLGGLFGDIVVAATSRELVRDGYLTMPRILAPSEIDLYRLKVSNGEFNIRQLVLRMMKADLMGDILTHWIENAWGMSSVGFAPNIEFSMRMVGKFSDAGIRAEHLDGNTPNEERDAILARLKCGETTVVWNVNVLTEGWDLPSLQCMIDASPTMSLARHLQRMGRVVRPADGLQKLVLDHAGNSLLHGSILRELEYSLEGTVRVKREVGEPDSVWQCESCFAILDEKPDVCPECGECSLKQRVIRIVNGKLVDLDERSHEFQHHFWNMLCRQAMESGRDTRWVMEQFNSRFGEWPIVVAGELINRRDRSKENKKKVYDHYRRISDESGYTPGWAAHRYRDVFGVWPRGVDTAWKEQLTTKYAGSA